MKVTVIDYGLSNLLSVRHAFAHFGAEVELTSKPEEILAARALVLPGVGAFRDGMEGLARLGLMEPIRQLQELPQPPVTFVGGAVVTPEYAKQMGADYYAKDARQSVEIARKVLE